MAPPRVPTQVQCINCRAGNLPGSPYCSRCGAPIADNAPVMMPAVSFPGSASQVDPVSRFSADGQDKALVKQTYERASAILTEGEAIEYIATGRGGLTHSGDCVVATNKRVMMFRKKVLGKFELDDCWWRDVGTASLAETKNGVSLKLAAIQGWNLSVESLPTAQATRIYNIAHQFSDHLQGSAAPTLAARPAAAAPSPAAIGHTASLMKAVMVEAASAPPPSYLSQPLASAGLSEPLQPLQDAVTLSPEPEPQAVEVEPVKPPVNFIPTPESVLQSILQSSDMEQGVPTRPMQWNAAAFQAPAVADVQPVMLTNHGTDTEPQMPHLPPLTTLERIAVFTHPSGPMGIDSTGRSSSPLDSSTLNESGVLSTAPSLDPTFLVGNISDTDALTNGSPSEYVTSAELPYSDDAQDEAGSYEEWASRDRISEISVPRLSLPIKAAPAPAAEPMPVVHADGGTLQPENSSVHVPATPAASPAVQADSYEAPPEAFAEAASAQYVETAHAAEPSPTQEQEQDETDYSSMRPTTPIGMEDFDLAMPGSLASGPLLAASSEMDAEMQDVYRNLSGMSTQRLESDTSLDLSDLATRINLTLHNTPVAAAPPQGKRPASQGQNAHSTDELKAARSGSARGSNSRAKADDPIAKMKQLKALLDAGLITEQDYTAKKADILSRI